MQPFAYVMNMDSNTVRTEINQQADHYIGEMSNLNKQELIKSLFGEIIEIITMIKDANETDLQTISAFYKLKNKNATSKKDILIGRILHEFETLHRQRKMIVTESMKYELDDKNKKEITKYK